LLVNHKAGIREGETEKGVKLIYKQQATNFGTYAKVLKKSLIRIGCLFTKTQYYKTFYICNLRTFLMH